ncbi:hypothetical protein CPB85DRAFT_1278541 [Mucidula mucida]|nr:hypothetical protein CPB85DRAFT_1278541 [Mucidula mucida]
MQTLYSAKFSLISSSCFHPLTRRLVSLLPKSFHGDESNIYHTLPHSEYQLWNTLSISALSDPSFHSFFLPLFLTNLIFSGFPPPRYPAPSILCMSVSCGTAECVTKSIRWADTNAPLSTPKSPVYKVEMDGGAC